MTSIVRRVLLSFLLAVVLFGPASPLGAVCGPCYSRCVDSCNLTRAACDEHCDAVCPSLYAPGSVELMVCLQACHGACLDESQDCKVLCKSNKFPQP
ncbi:MAG: hypothetical protein ACREAA_11325 [Candidatus Polarisedimenticolia bacterium]